MESAFGIVAAVALATVSPVAALLLTTSTWVIKYTSQVMLESVPLLFSLIGFIAASVLCGLSGSLGMLIFARVMQGLCGGGLLAKAQSLLFETFPSKQQPAAQAIFGIGVIAAGVCIWLRKVFGLRPSGCRVRPRTATCS